MAPTRIFTRLEAALGDIGFELIADLVGACPAARGIGRHRVRLAAAEQPPHRLAERFAKNVPQRDVDGADRGDRHAAPRDLRHGMAGGSGGGRHAMPLYCMSQIGADVARIAADQLRPDLVVQHVDQRAVGCRRCRRRSCLRPSRRCRHRSRCAGSPRRTSAPGRNRCGAGVRFRWVFGPTRL